MSAAGEQRLEQTLELGESSAAMTPWVAMTDSFQGWRSVAAAMPASWAPARLTGLSSINRSIPIWRQRPILSIDR